MEDRSISMDTLGHQEILVVLTFFAQRQVNTLQPLAYSSPAACRHLGDL